MEPNPEPKPESPEPTHFARPKPESEPPNLLFGAVVGAGAVKNRTAPAPKAPKKDTYDHYENRSE